MDGVATSFVCDGANIVQELTGIAANNSDPSTVRASYISGGIDEVFAQSSGMGTTAQTLTYLSDALGSTIRLVDTIGTKVVGYSYEPYGNTSADAIVHNPFQYTGRENDGMGLYYYRARYYSTNLARFISSDPIGLMGGINTYAYVKGDPISYIDPEGLAAKYEKPSNPNKKPPPEHRVPSGERERNVGHDKGEEHSRTPKGQRGNKGSRGARGLGPSMIYDLACSVMEVTDPGNPFCNPPPEECNI